MSNEYPEVPFAEHYKVFKDVESKIMKHLAEIGPNEYLIGLRVAYDFVDSASEPGIMPYVIEFGRLSAQKALNPSSDSTPSQKKENQWFSAAYMDEIRDDIKAALEAWTQPALLIVGITINVHGIKAPMFQGLESFDVQESTPVEYDDDEVENLLWPCNCHTSNGTPGLKRYNPNKGVEECQPGGCMGR